MSRRTDQPRPRSIVYLPTVIDAYWRPARRWIPVGHIPVRPIGWRTLQALNGGRVPVVVGVVEVAR